MTNKDAKVVKICTLMHAHAFVPQCLCDKADINMERKNLVCRCIFSLCLSFIIKQIRTSLNIPRVCFVNQPELTVSYSHLEHPGGSSECSCHCVQLTLVSLTESLRYNMPNVFSMATGSQWRKSYNKSEETGRWAPIQEVLRCLNSVAQLCSGT